MSNPLLDAIMAQAAADAERFEQESHAVNLAWFHNDLDKFLTAKRSELGANREEGEGDGDPGA